MEVNKSVDHFLEAASADARKQFIDSCAASCSASYSRGVYERAFSGGLSLADALAELRRAFADFDFTVISERSVEIRYSRCACDLVVDSLVSSPILCLCSVKSCLLNWEAIYGEGNVQVELKESILRGDERCLLSVTLAAENYRSEMVTRG